METFEQWLFSNYLGCHNLPQKHQTLMKLAYDAGQESVTDKKTIAHLRLVIKLIDPEVSDFDIDEMLNMVEEHYPNPPAS